MAEEREFAHLLVYFPKSYSSWSRARLKPEVRNYIQFSYMGAGAQGLRASSSAFPGT